MATVWAITETEIKTGLKWAGTALFAKKEMAEDYARALNDENINKDEFTFGIEELEVIE